MFIAGHIASFVVAILLSVFYLGCAISSLGNRIIANEDKAISISQPQQQSPTATILLSDAVVTIAADDLPTAYPLEVRGALIPFACGEYIKERCYSTFSRPPPIPIS